MKRYMAYYNNECDFGVRLITTEDDLDFERAKDSFPKAHRELLALIQDKINYLRNSRS